MMGGAGRICRDGEESFTCTGVGKGAACRGGPNAIDAGAAETDDDGIGEGGETEDGITALGTDRVAEAWAGAAGPALVVIVFSTMITLLITTAMTSSTIASKNPWRCRDGAAIVGAWLVW